MASSSVEVSTDGGKTWTAATLGKDLGRFAFRPLSLPRHAGGAGQLTVIARATNKVGQTQTAELIQNPAGYHNNVLQTLTLNGRLRRTTMRTIAVAAFCRAPRRAGARRTRSR